MRHAIIVVGSEAQRREPDPRVVPQEGEPLRSTTWFARSNEQDSAPLLEDFRSALRRMLLVPLLAYRFYLLVHNTRLWSGKRPLILVRGRGLASRIAAYAGTWGGGDVVKADQTDARPLGPTRFILDADGNLKLYAA